jgi:hypothetical protein
MFIHDIYILGASDPFQIKEFDEVTVDLELRKVSSRYHTILTGRVLYKDFPIKNATVKVFDHDFKPLFHAVTNEKGIYHFKHLLKPGEYKVIAVANGFRTSDTKNVRILENAVTKLSFSLIRCFLPGRGIVYGRIMEAVGRKPVKNAAVCLMGFLNGQKTIYETTSNHSGNYLFYDILPNQYAMTVKKPGFRFQGPIWLQVERQDRIVLHVDLVRKRNASFNSIYGMVTFERKPVCDAAVILYRIESADAGNNSLVQIQKTNEQGVFLFGGIAEGLYQLKGKLQNGVTFKKNVTVGINHKARSVEMK